MGINIHVVAGQDKQSSSINAAGSVQHIITDEERASFGVGDKQLKNLVKAYFGKAPNDAFLHSSTPWGDLYKKYSWPQVQMVLVVQKAEILSLTSEPIIVKTQTFKNNSKVAGQFNCAVTDSVTNTVSSNWSTGGTLSIGEKFKVDVGIPGVASGDAETSISYSQSWGIGGTESKSVSVGSSSGVSVTLNPGESVKAELSASRGNLKARITYRAYLIGSAAVNYNPTFKDHHFWGLDIGAVTKHKSITTTQDIEVGYYSDSSTELKDPKTKKMLKSFPAAHLAA